MPASSSPWICSFARVRGVWVVVIFFVFLFIVEGGSCCRRVEVDGRWLDG